MSGAKGYDLDAIREREMNAESPFPPLLLGGKEFKILPESLWGDGFWTATVSGNVLDMATALLGAEQYKEFAEAGGTATLLITAFQEIQGATLPES